MRRLIRSTISCQRSVGNTILSCLIVCLMTSAMCVATTSADEPTLARLAFWVPSDRMAEFDSAFTTGVVPLLKKHNMVPSAERARPTPDGVFSRESAFAALGTYPRLSVYSRLLAFSSPSEFLARREALQADPAFGSALQDLGRASGAVAARGSAISETGQEKGDLPIFHRWAA